MDLQKIIEKIETRKRNSKKFWCELVPEISEYLDLPVDICIYSPIEFFCPELGAGHACFGVQDGRIVVHYQELCYILPQDVWEREYTISFQQAIQSFIALLEKLAELETYNKEISAIEKILAEIKKEA